MYCLIFLEKTLGPFKATKSNGICLDQAQINILERSWRCSNPEKLSALKDE